MRFQTAVPIAISLLAGACHFGGNPRQFALGREPRGAEIIVATTDGQFTGELLAVADSGLTILTTGRITLFLYRRLERVQSAELRVLARSGYPLTSYQREHLRLHARYPQGIDAELMRRLLDAYEQSALEIVSE